MGHEVIFIPVVLIFVLLPGLIMQVKLTLEGLKLYRDGNMRCQGEEKSSCRTSKRLYGIR